MTPTKKEIIELFDNLKGFGIIAPGIDKVGYNTVKTKGLLVNYTDYIYDALKGVKPYYFTKYREVLKIKGKDKKPRVLSVPCMRDRLMLKVLQKYYFNAYVKRMPFNEIIDNLFDELRSKKYTHVIKLDVKGFFDNICLDDVKNELMKMGYGGQIIDITMTALRTRTISAKDNRKDIERVDLLKKQGIPQGIIISNAIAEIIGKKIDEGINEALRLKGVSFHRFVDDMIVLYDSRKITKSQIIKTISSILRSFSLKLNNEKTKVKRINDDITFLGYTIKDNKITIDQQAFAKKASKIERVIFDFANAKSSKIKENYNYLLWKLNNEIAGFKVNGKYYSWPHYYKKVNDLGVYYRLDRIVKKLYYRAKLDIGRFSEVKKFIIARFAVFEENSSYIPDFKSKYASLDDKKNLLVNLFNIPSNTSPIQIEDMFDALVQKSIFDMEKDLDFRFSL